MQAPHANDICRVLAMQKKVIADFIQSRFPDQFLIPVADFAKLAGESYGGCRNRIATGTFSLRVIQRGSRNFVAVTDVIDYLARLIAGGEDLAQEAITTNKDAGEQAVEQKGRRSKYGEAAKARAAAARAARAAKREARATTVCGVA